MSETLQPSIARTLAPYADKAWIVGLSGGVDSTALLHLTRQAAAALHPPALCAAHLNHQLRGEESDEDAIFCSTLCADWSIPCTVHAEKVAQRAQWSGLGIEEAGRLARLALFAEVARAYTNPLILLAHHGDDQVETTLFRLLRGTGLRGLAAMRFLTTLHAPDGTPLTILRPFLQHTKSELVAYAKAQALPWREDRSNDEDDYTRNRIRHEVVPVLAVIDPQASRHVRQTAERLREVEEWLGETAAALYAQSVTETGEGLLLRLPAETPLPVLRRLVEMLGERLLKTPGYVWNAPASVVGMLQQADLGVNLELPGGLRLFRDRAAWVVSTADTPRPPAPTVHLLQGPRPIRAGDATLSILVEEYSEFSGTIPEADRNDPEVEWFDAEALRLPLILRPRAAGDRLRPLGAPGSRKVKEILIDAKASRAQKDRARLLLDAEGPLWLWPYRRAHRARITPKTESALRVVIRAK